MPEKDDELEEFLQHEDEDFLEFVESDSDTKLPDTELLDERGLEFSDHQQQGQKADCSGPPHKRGLAPAWPSKILWQNHEDFENWLAKKRPETWCCPFPCLV
jgi:hypothetical protein